MGDAHKGSSNRSGYLPPSYGGRYTGVEDVVSTTRSQMLHDLLERMRSPAHRTLPPLGDFSMLTKTVLNLGQAMPRTVETNAQEVLLNSRILHELACSMKCIHGAVDQLLATSEVHHVGMKTDHRQRAFKTLLLPSGDDANGLTPVEAQSNAAIRKYSSTITFQTTLDSTQITVFLPAIYERNADNGCFLYIKLFTETPFGLSLVDDRTTIIIPTTEASWGHFSSGFEFANTSATDDTRGTVSATAASPSTKGFAGIRGADLVKITETVRDRGVRAQPQNRVLFVRNDCSTRYMTIRNRSSPSMAPFLQTTVATQNLLASGDETFTDTIESRRLAPIQIFDSQGCGATAVSPYFSRSQHDRTALAFIEISGSGTGYTTPPTITIPDPGKYGVQATAVATIVGGVLTEVTITEHGHGYTSAPTISVTGGGAPTAVSTMVAHLVGSASGQGSLAGRAVPNFSMPAEGVGSWSANNVSTAEPSAGWKGNSPLAGFPKPADHAGALTVRRLASLQPVGRDDAPLLVGARFRVKGTITKTWHDVDDTDDNVMQFLYLFATAQSDNGVTYGFHTGPDTGPGQIGIPEPFAGVGDRAPTAKPAGFTPYGEDFGDARPMNYAIIDLNSVGRLYGEGTVVPIDATIIIDNTLGADGSGFWPVAYGTSDGTADGGTSARTGLPALNTLDDAILDRDGWSRWNRSSARQFSPYKPFNLERSNLYAMVLTGNLANGETEQAMSTWDLSNITVEVESLRSATEAGDRIAIACASNQGQAQYGIKVDVNTVSRPKDSETVAFPIVGDPVVTDDLCKTLSVLPNAHMGSKVDMSR
uniref:Tail protein n=1 Tax=viral metagenome TaxID=1070528 RepID=A0A2V0RB21_9ZZZZ